MSICLKEVQDDLALGKRKLVKCKLKTFEQRATIMFIMEFLCFT